MKRIWILTFLALAAFGLSGCNSDGCGNGGLFGNLFQRNGGSPPQYAANGAARYAARPPVVNENQVETASTQAP